MQLAESGSRRACPAAGDAQRGASLAADVVRAVGKWAITLDEALMRCWRAERIKVEAMRKSRRQRDRSVEHPGTCIRRPADADTISRAASSA